MKLNDGNGTTVKSNSCSSRIYKIKRCLKLLFRHLRRQAIYIILGDLCKQEAAFIAGWILPEENRKDIRTFYNHEPELEKTVT